MEDSCHIVVLHTHPLELRNEDGDVMGQLDTMGLQHTIHFSDAKNDSSMRNVLFSRGDIQLFVEEAERVHREGERYERLGLYRRDEDGGGLFFNWVQHPLGAAVAEVRVGAHGRTVGVEVRYGRRSEWLMNRDDLHSAQRVRDLAAKLGIPVEVREVPYDEVESSFPVRK
jgi:hypothetical protein